MSAVAWVGAVALVGVAGAVLFPRVVLDPWFRRMLRPKQRAPRGLPAHLARRAEDVTVAAGSVPIKAWLVRPEGEAAGLAVFIHGWSSDGGRMAPLAAHVVGAGVACLLVDLPGHGRTGRTDTYNAKIMVEDLGAVRDWIEARGDLASLNGAILGYSFGGVGAIVAAVRDGRWKALVVMATPVGPMQAIEIHLEHRGMPVRWLRRPLHDAAQRVIGVDPETFAGPQNLRSLRVPALFVYGGEDSVVPPLHGERLHASAPRELAQLVIVDGAGHDGLLVDPEAGKRVGEFLARVLGGVALERREERG
jgi:pimeloyl-ACP methyl ester carboxylesterase